MKKIILIVVILCLFSAYIVYGNFSITTTKITVKSEALPSSFKGYKIVHISDLHNSEFGDDSRMLLSLIRKANPDIIVITGDIVDSRRTDIDTAEDFIEDALKIAPVYYSTGNHESRIKNFSHMEKEFIEEGVVVLRNEAQYISKGNDNILIIGVDDPSFKGENIKETINSLKDENTFNLLLSHRPELFETYESEGIELTLSGHAHGGQFRIPFIGGLYAPNQGFFPEYTSGLHTSNNSNLVVSRGLGNSLFPFRFNNKPEILVITLE